MVLHWPLAFKETPIVATSSAIVVGGGITGTATAYELSKRGVDVTVLERGQLHAMGSGWTLAGVRQSGRKSEELAIAREAIHRWEILGEELGADLEYRQEGNLRLALTADEVEIVQRVVADGDAAGIKMRYLDGQAAREIAPEITEHVMGASFCPTDGHANNHKTVQAYARAAVRLGAEIFTGVDVLSLITAGNSVTGVMTSNGAYSADMVILATGIYTPQLLTPLGLSLPIDIVLCPVAETIPTQSFKLAPVLGHAHGHFAARQTTAGCVRFIGASVPWNEDPHEPANINMTVRQMDDMTRIGIEMLPGITELRVDRVWGGLIDQTPDVLPVLDAVEEYSGLIVGAGFSGHGFGIGPMSGEILANLATTGKDDRFDLAPFRLARFADDKVERESLEMLG